MPFNAQASLAPRDEISRVILQGAALNRTLIWDQILPPLPINNQTAHLPKLAIAAAELLRIINDETAPGQNIPRIIAGIADFFLAIAIRKQEIGIPYEAEMTYAKIFSLQAFYSKVLGKDILSLTAEYLTMQALFNPTTFGAATNSAVPYTEANSATNSMMQDIVIALNRVKDQGEIADTVVIPSQVLERAADSTKVANYVMGQLAATSEVNSTSIETALKRIGWDVKVLVGTAQYNAGAKNQLSLQRVWSPSYIWVGRRGYKNDTTDEGVPILDGVGGSVYWQEYGLMNGEAYLDQPKEQVVVRGKMSANPTVTNPNCGTLIATQFA